VEAKRKKEKRKNDTPAKRAFGDFMKRIYNKKWMQQIPDDTEWHYPEQSTSSADSGGDITSQTNLGGAT